MSESTEGHIVRQFDADLAELRLSLLEMGGLVLSQVDKAVDVLVSGDDEAARAVISRDAEVNAYDELITDRSIRVLAQRQPLASDLRAVISIGRAVRDLERIGDEAKKIAAYGVDIRSAGSRTPLGQFYRDARRMAGLVLSLLRDAIRAFDSLDGQIAGRLSARDAEIDAEFRSAMRHLVTLVMEDQRQLRHTINTVFVLKALERIGDHAVNLAEGITYLVSGKRPRG